MRSSYEEAHVQNNVMTVDFDSAQGPGQRSMLALGRALCLASMIFASGDVWPVLHLGFTFRVAQICIFMAALVLITNRNLSIRPFPGLVGIYAFCTWIALTLPFSLFLERSIGYVVWAISDALIVFVFAQYFRTQFAVLNLFRWTLIAYLAISIFGFLQFALYFRGIDLFVTEYWIKGRIARVNGLSYEPSYYATYLIAGWVTCMYLFESRATIPSPRFQRICLIATTGALLLCSSRMGYVMMVLWLFFRVSRRPIRSVLRGAAKRTGVRIAVGAATMTVLCLLAVIRYRRRLITLAAALPFLFAGLGLMGHSAQSAHTRLESFVRTWIAFAEHPLIGTGIGALPVAIASQTGHGVYDLKQAKGFEGMSIAAEVLAETGLIGASLACAAILQVVRRYRIAKRDAPEWHRKILAAQAWGLVWMLMMLQMNQNFLRIYIFVDLAVLICIILMQVDVQLMPDLIRKSPEN